MKASSLIALFLHGRQGVYTTMRTVGHAQKIFAYRDHIKRLALVREAIDASGKYGGFEEAATASLITPQVRAAILSKQNVTGELKVSVALRMRETSEKKALIETTLEDMEVCIAVEDLTEMSSSPVCVQAAFATRDNPTVKHGAWIEQRKQLEASMRKECNEVILVDSVSGGVVEGSIVLFCR
jgi:hypothetical protein